MEKSNPQVIMLHLLRALQVVYYFVPVLLDVLVMRVKPHVF